MTSPVERVLGALRARGHQVRAKGPSTWDAQCPTCESPHLHLRVEQAPDGRALVHCIADCDTEAWLAKVGLQMRDLYPSGNGHAGGLRLAEFLAAKGLSVETARACGVSEEQDTEGRWRVAFTYRRGDKVSRRYRTSLDHDNEFCFLWEKGARPKRNGLVLATWESIRAERYALGWEGETDFLSAVWAGYPSLAFPGAGMVNPETLAEDLRGAGVERLYVCNERDEKARKFLASFGKRPEEAVQVLVFDCAEHRDGNDAMRADPDGFADFLKSRMAAARPLREVLADAVPERKAASAPAEAESTGNAERPATSRYNRSDAGNAEILRDLFGEELIFRYGLEDWLHYDGARWPPDTTGEAQRLALKAARWRWNQAAAIPDSEERKKEAGWAITSESAIRIKYGLGIAARGIEPGLGREADAFDAHPALLNCLNGVADLETGALHDHDRGLLMTKLAGAAYEPGARSELWERVVSEILSGDEELIAFIQRYAGYSATGFVREHKFLFAYGGGNNGKDVVINTIRTALGEYGHAGSFSTFTMERAKRGGPREDLCNLLGRRMFTAAETGGSAVFDEAAIKATTSSNPITTEHKFGREFSFLPTHTTWLAANVKPRVKDPTAGFWRRLLLVPFREDFTGRADLQLEEKLRRSELPGVLAWVVRGAVLWHREGLNPPQKVQIATAQYRGREDLVGRFLRDAVRRDPEGEVGATNLYTAYAAWCERVGEMHPGRQADFGEEMARHSLSSVRATSGQLRGKYVYRGLAIDSESEEAGGV